MMDKIAILISEQQAVQVAKREAQKLGYSLKSYRVGLERRQSNVNTGDWIVYFEPIPPEGTAIKGGDLLVYVDAKTGQVAQIKRGQ